MPVSNDSLVRRPLCAIVAFLSFAHILSMFVLGGGVSSSAEAYTPVDLSANSEGPDAELSTTLSHDPVKPDFGDTVTYTGTLNFGNIPEELDGDVTLTVSSDFYAPFAGGDAASKLTWTGYPQGSEPTLLEAPSSPDNGLTWVYKFDGVESNTSVTYRNTATVKSKTEVPAGQTIFATMKANFVATPKIAATAATPVFHPEPGNACKGVMEFPSEPLTAGAWLVDIKIANSGNNGAVEVDRSPYVAEEGAPANANTIKITHNGTDITAQKLQGATYLPSDSSAPVYKDGIPWIGQYPDATWLDSLNWKYDPKTFTGDTWLPKGSVITVRKHVTFLNCFAGAALDFDPARQVIYALEIGRPVAKTDSNALTSFTMPGEPFVPKPCTNLYWSQDVRGSGSFGLFTSLDPPTSLRTGVIETSNGSPSSTADIAISDKYPYHLYYLNGGNTMYYDYKTKQFVDTGVDASDLWNGNSRGAGDGDKNPDSLGFDKEGVLYSFRPSKSDGSRNGVIMTLYRLNVPLLEQKLAAGDTSGLPQWERVLEVRNATPKDQYGRSVYDLVFDEDGNLYGLATPSSSGNRPVNIFKITAAEIAAGADIDTPPMVLLKNTHQGYGMAFGTDGKLYIGNSAGQFYTTTLDAVNAEMSGSPRTYGVGGWYYKYNGDVRLTPVGRIKGENNNPQNIPPNYGGLASCNFGKPVPPPPHGPEFKVQKSVINPRTGQVLPPGENSMDDRVQVDAQGNAVIDYAVVVSNKGNEKGTPPVIRDTVSVPSGFTITDIKVDGVSQGTNTSLNLQAGELAPGSYDPNGPVPTGSSAQVFRISVSVHTDDVTGYSWIAADGCSDGNDSQGKGFHNTVAMDDDADGDENNHACVPTVTPSPAKLYLYKQIVNSEQTIVVAGAQFDDRRVNPRWWDYPRYSQEQEDLKSFNLSAVPSSTVAGAVPTPLSGQVDPDARNIGDKAVGGLVSAGVYNLLESPINDKAGSEYSMVDVECRNQNKDTVLASTNQQPAQVTVNKGDTIHCIFSNKPEIKAHVVKTATDPAVAPDANTGNPHIGKPVVADENGVYNFKYTIAVTNDSSKAGNTGEIRDYFRVPAGMKWKDGATATVKFVPGSSRTDLDRTGADGAGSTIISLTKEELTRPSNSSTHLPGGALLAKSIKNLAPGAAGTSKFEVTVPLVADEDVVAGSNPQQTKFEKNLASLGSCENKNRGGNRFTTTKTGVPNSVSLENEYQGYSPIAIEDNIACIPVNSASFHVVKTAANQDGNLNNPHVGVKLVPNDKNEITASYFVDVVADAAASVVADTGKITDHFEIPEGLLWRDGEQARVYFLSDNKYLDDSRYQNNAMYVDKDTFLAPEGFTLTESLKDVEGKKSIRFMVSIPLKLDMTKTSTGDTKFDQHKETLGECVNQQSADGAYTETGKGIVNQVKLEKESTTYSKLHEKDNFACIPVEAPPKGTITVIKKDSEDTELPGAEFAIYPDVDGQPGGTAIAVNADEQGGARFTSAELDRNKVYWLVETKAPYVDKADEQQRYNLLAKPLKFKLTAAGVVAYEDGSDTEATSANGVISVDGGTFEISGTEVTVHDTRTAVLPYAGGFGHGWIAILAALLVASGIFGAYTTASSGRRRVG